MFLARMHEISLIIAGWLYYLNGFECSVGIYKN